MCFLVRMGQLISRLFKRLGSSSSNQNSDQSNRQQQQQQQMRPEAHSDFAADTQDSCPRQEVQSIPVGQSIDSAEYTALARANDIKGQIAEDVEPTNEHGDKQGDKRVGVEEAVIKIQALIRGHLTRKALKDTQQFSSLGQSQFDQETLMSTPSGPLFDLPNQEDSNWQPRAAAGSIGQKSTDGAVPSDESSPPRSVSPNTRLGKLNLQTRSLGAPSKQLEMPSPSSPGPSESGASIDLCGGECASPVSASASASASASISIDILDHNIRPNEQMASVLHHKTSTDELGQEATRANGNRDQLYSELHNSFAPTLPAEPVCSANGEQSPPLPADSREQAAIRIQSAFRGYKTRKSSPYRKQSPRQQLSNGFTNHLEDDEDQDQLELEANEHLEHGANSCELLATRRQSRTRDRLSLDNTSEQATSTNQAQAQPAQLQQQQQQEDSKSLQGVAPAQTPIGQLADNQSLGSADVLTVISVGSDTPQKGFIVKKDLSKEHEQLKEQLEKQQQQQEDQDLLEEDSTNDQQEDTFAPTTSETLDFDANDATNALTAPLDNSTAPLSLDLTQTTTGSDTKAAAEPALTQDVQFARRQSDLSQEDIITDSSLLGAALSFNETPSQLEEEITPTHNEAEAAAIAQMEAEAEQLAAELDWSMNELGEQSEQVQERTVDELESDDLERRDPSGQMGTQIELQVAQSNISQELECSQTQQQVETNDSSSDKQAEAENVASSSRSSSFASSKSDKENKPEQQVAGETQTAEDAQENDSKDNDEQHKLTKQQQMQQQGKPYRNKSRNKNKRKGGKK